MRSARSRLAGVLLVLALAGLAFVHGAPDRSPAGVGTAGAAAPAGPLAPGEVQAGVYISNIQTVNLPTNSFDADFYLWLRWSDPGIDPTAGVEVMNPHQSWALVVTPLHDAPQRQPDGSLLWLARYQGSFNAPLTLADYPFESQTLRILIEDGEQSITRIRYVADQDPIALDSEVTLPGYRIGAPRIEFGAHTYDSSFGQRGATSPDRTYPRITVDIPLSSPVVSGFIKTILPILIVLIAAALALVIPAPHVDSRIAVPITSLLALIAMHWGVSSSLPEVTYLLMIDLLYILAYAAVTAMLAGTIAVSRVLRSRGETAAATLDRRLLVVIGVGYPVLLATVLAVYLRG